MQKEEVVCTVVRRKDSPSTTEDIYNSSHHATLEFRSMIEVGDECGEVQAEVWSLAMKAHCCLHQIGIPMGKHFAHNIARRLSMEKVRQINPTGDEGIMKHCDADRVAS